MARESTPTRRAAEGKKEVASVRKRYKVNVNKKRRLRPAEIPHVQDMIVVLQLAGYSNVQKARIVGISRGQVAEILDEPEVQEKLVTLRAQLPQAALELLQGYMIEAVQAIVDVLRTTKDEKYVLQAASEILDRAGIPKASKQERHQVLEERTVITDDGIVEALRDASPEVQEQAAQMIEQLEVLLATADTESTEESADE